MSAVVDRITEVLRDHQPVATWDVRDSFWCQGCQRSYPDDAFTAHVAERITATVQDDLAAEFQRGYQQGYRHGTADNSGYMP